MAFFSRISGGGVLERLDRIEAGLRGLGEQVAALDTRLDSLGREAELRAEIDRLRGELDGLSQQSLHVVELLGESRRRVRHLESKSSESKSGESEQGTP